MARTQKANRAVTISDVARAAGVAPMTVSRYLNQHPNMSEKTARKVASAIKRLDYTPNIAARILMGQPSNTIGLIVPTLADAFFSEIAHSIQASAHEHGKLVWVASSNSDLEIEASLIQQMKQHHVDGLLLIPTAGSSPVYTMSDASPLVVLDRPVAEKCDAVLVDNRGGAASLVEHFVWHGYKRILCLSFDTTSVYTIAERVAGYEDVMRKHRLKRSIHSSSMSLEDLRRTLRAEMKSASPPQAIICTNNVTTIHTLALLFEDGYNLPGDVAVGGFDDFELAPFMRPGVTVVTQSATDLGRQAARLLFERLTPKSEGMSFATTVLPTSLTIRGSCGCKESRT